MNRSLKTAALLFALVGQHCGSESPALAPSLVEPRASEGPTRAASPKSASGSAAEEPPPESFWPAEHSNLVYHYMSRHPLCRMRMATCAFNQDVDQVTSAKHFDNCAFEEGIDYINNRLVVTDSFVAKRDWWEAMRTLGEAVHGIQDFYSHSNYVEDFADELSAGYVVPVWTDEGQQQLRDLVARGLVSGTWNRGTPKLCPPGTPSHDEMNKDHPTFSTRGARRLVKPAWSATGFDAAMRLADLATYEFLAYAFSRWPYLNRECGPA